ncbi:MAG: carboxypeptidase-like regulatory domain-containing protein, partial [Singulisphaera sp.]
MIPPDDISADLPAPRDDEPRELRRDIADELADHLASSLGHERLKEDQIRGRSEEELTSAVLDRFGDPGQVARRLWWDAMREKIMAQRFMMGVSLVAAAAAIAAVVLLGQMVSTSRATQEQLLADQREWMQAVLTELRTPRESANGADPSDQWQLLRVKLVDDAGQPVTGDVYCNQQGESGVNQQIPTDADGVADFGHLPTGPYTIMARATKTGELGGSLRILLGPARPTEYSIACPSSEPELVGPRFAIDVPDDLAAEPLYFVAQMSRYGRKVKGQVWTPHDASQIRYLLLDARGELLGELPVDIIEEQGSSGSATWRTMRTQFTPGENLETLPRLPEGEYQINVGAYISRNSKDEGASNPLTMISTEFLRKNASIDSAEGAIKLGLESPQFWQGARKQLSQSKVSQAPFTATPSSANASTAPETMVPYVAPPAPFAASAPPTPPYVQPQPPAAEVAPVRIVIETPDRLKDEPLYYLVCFIPKPEHVANPQPSSSAKFLFVDSRGAVLGEVSQKGPGWEQFLPVTSATGLEITFPAKVLQRLPLLPHRGLAAGEFDVIAVSYLAAQKETVAGERPTIEAINGSDVFLGRLDIDAPDDATVQIGAEQTDFWRGIDEVLHEWALE